MKFYSRRCVSPVITIVSLVDILTMVLMFFVYTTTFKTNQPQVVIDLPKVVNGGEKETATNNMTILSVSKEGAVYLDAKEVSLADIGISVKALQEKGQAFSMKADEKAPFGTIMTVLDTLKGAGVPNLPAVTRNQ